MRNYKLRHLFSFLLAFLLSFSVLLTTAVCNVSAVEYDEDEDEINIEDFVPFSKYVTDVSLMPAGISLFAVAEDEEEVEYLYNRTWWFSSSSATPSSSKGYTESYNNGTRWIKKDSSGNWDYSTYNYWESGGVPLTSLQVGGKYRFKYTLTIPNNPKGSFQLYLYDINNTDNKIVLLKNDKYNNISTAVTTELTVEIPTSWSGKVGLQLRADGFTDNTKRFEIYFTDITIRDVTSEALDGALAKFGNKIKGFFDNLLNGIKEALNGLLDGIKGLFIPQDGFFETIKTEFETLLSEHLGFLYTAPAMVVDIFTQVGEWTPSETPRITLPSFDFNINGKHVHLWDEIVYTFDFLNQAPFSTLYGFYKTFIFVMLSVAMINLAIKKYHSIVGGGDSDN